MVGAEHTLLNMDSGLLSDMHQVYHLQASTETATLRTLALRLLAIIGTTLSLILSGPQRGHVSHARPGIQVSAQVWTSTSGV
jgi:hypothetical protein